MQHDRINMLVLRGAAAHIHLNTVQTVNVRIIMLVLLDAAAHTGIHVKTAQTVKVRMTFSS